MVSTLFGILPSYGDTPDIFSTRSPSGATSIGRAAASGATSIGRAAASMLSPSAATCFPRDAMKDLSGASAGLGRAAASMPSPSAISFSRARYSASLAACSSAIVGSPIAARNSSSFLFRASPPILLASPYPSMCFRFSLINFLLAFVCADLRPDVLFPSSV